MNAVCVRRDSFVRSAALVAVVVGGVVAPATGCRSGSWVTKPSWMTFGQKPEDADRLASAPAGAGDVPKPSAIAEPYPTTSTPAGYSLPDATAQAATAPGATPAAVTYGATPPPAATAAALVPPASSAAPPIAPQVGPYASSVAAAPGAGSPATPGTPAEAAWSTPPLAAIPPATTEPPPATVSTAPPPWAATPAAAPGTTPPERFADARAASPAWTPAPLEPPPADGRYAASGTSRFSGGAMPSAASSAPAATPAAVPAELPSAVEPPAAGMPSSPAAPLRRPDPGYRPGGTSSYRPARSSLAGDPPAGVQPASYQPSQTAAH